MFIKAKPTLYQTPFTMKIYYTEHVNKINIQGESECRKFN